MLLTVITINLNNAKGLAQTMASVLMQDYRPIEYIVVDGGSMDGSLEVIQNYKEQLTHWESLPDRGIYHAMNKGLAKASGEYVLFLNSGDTFLHPGALSLLAAKAATDLVYGHLRIDNPDGSHYEKIYPDQPNKTYFRHDTLPHSATLIRTRMPRDAGGYDESLKIVADWKFFAQAILKKGATLQHIAEPVAAFAYNGLSSLPENQPLLEAEMTKVWNELFPPPGFLVRMFQRLRRKVKRVMG